jgi:hypothetical protein
MPRPTIETAIVTAETIGRTLKATICSTSKILGLAFTWVIHTREKQPSHISISRKHKRHSSWNGPVSITIISADCPSSQEVFQINIIQLQGIMPTYESSGGMVHSSTICKTLKVTSPKRQPTPKLMDSLKERSTLWLKINH